MDNDKNRWGLTVPRSGRCPKCSRHGGVLEEHSRVNNNAFLMKGLSLRQEPRAVGRNGWEMVGMVSSEGAEGPVHEVDVMYMLGNCMRHELKCFQ